MKFYYHCKGDPTCPDTRWYYYKQDNPLQPHLLYNGNQLHPGYDASRFKINKLSSFSELIITELHFKDSGIHTAVVQNPQYPHAFSNYVFYTVRLNAK